MELRRASTLLLAAGIAGAVTAFALLLGDMANVASPVARIAGIFFQLLVTLALAPGVASVLRSTSGADRQQRLFAMMGSLLWFAGVGTAFMTPNASRDLLLGADSLALVAGGILALAGWLALRPTLTRKERRAARRQA